MVLEGERKLMTRKDRCNIHLGVCQIGWSSTIGPSHFSFNYGEFEGPAAFRRGVGGPDSGGPASEGPASEGPALEGPALEGHASEEPDSEGLHSEGPHSEKSLLKVSDPLGTIRDP